MGTQANVRRGGAGCAQRLTTGAGCAASLALVLLDTTLPAEDSVQLAEQITASPTLAGACIVMMSPVIQGASLARWREMKGATQDEALAPSELWEAITMVLAPLAVMTLSTS